MIKHHSNREQTLEHVLFHPIRSKEPPIFNFATLSSAKYFYKMTSTAGPSCGEMGINSENKNCRVSLEYITNNWMGRLDCVNATFFIIHKNI